MNKFFSTIRNGLEYSRIWPLRHELLTYFPDGMVIKLTQLSFSLFPIIAAIIIFLQINILGTEYMPQAIATILLILSFPIQGWLWLGKRAQTPLPPSTVSWYRSIHERMREQGCDSIQLKSKPHYLELAKLLQFAFKEMDKAFIKHMLE